MLIACGKVNEELTEAVKSLKERLTDAGFRCIIDDNPNRSMGEKLYYWEMKGVPMRLELGARDLAK